MLSDGQTISYPFMRRREAHVRFSRAQTVYRPRVARAISRCSHPGLQGPFGFAQGCHRGPRARGPHTCGPHTRGTRAMGFSRCAATDWVLNTEGPSLRGAPGRGGADGQSIIMPYRDPSTFSEGDWRHCYVGLEGPSTF